MAKYDKNLYKRKSSTSTVGEGIKDMLKAYQLDRKFEETRLINSWGRVMGESIAKRTTKVYIRDKKMFVQLSSAPLRHELSASRSKVLGLFMAEFGQLIVDDVVFI